MNVGKKGKQCSHSGKYYKVSSETRRKKGHMIKQARSKRMRDISTLPHSLQHYL